MTGESTWRLWQFLDSAFPTGGYAHSGGLEAARQNGGIAGRTGLEGWLAAGLSQLAWSSLPWVAAGHRDPSCLASLDEDCDAFLSNPVSNRASRQQGAALLLAAGHAFGPELDREVPLTRCRHLAPTFGAVCRVLGFPLEESLRGHVFVQLRGWIAAAVRLNIVGPLAAQQVQAGLAGLAEAVVQQGMKVDLEDVAVTAPLIELWQGTQDRLYSRLFQT